MKTICYGCGAVLSDDLVPAGPDGAVLVSHGLCARCLVRLHPELAAEAVRCGGLIR